MLKSGLLMGSYDPADGFVALAKHKGDTWEHLLEVLFVLCAICHLFLNVIVKILCVLLDCMCSASFCVAIYCGMLKVCDACAKCVKRKGSGSTCPFPTPICSHFLDFFLGFQNNLVHLDTPVVLIIMETGCSPLLIQL